MPIVEQNMSFIPFSHLHSTKKEFFGRKYSEHGPIEFKMTAVKRTTRANVYTLRMDIA
jgi:hypothetical protein